MSAPRIGRTWVVQAAYGSRHARFEAANRQSLSRVGVRLGIDAIVTFVADDRRRVVDHDSSRTIPAGLDRLGVKDLISASMEDATGVSAREDGLPGVPAWARSRSLLTRDVNATAAADLRRRWHPPWPERAPQRLADLPWPAP
jgi:hypothetical protein